MVRLSSLVTRGIKYAFLLSQMFLSCTKENLQTEHSEVSDIKEWFNYLCSPSLGGRYSGSSGIKASCDYICGTINVKEDTLNVIQFVENGISFQNILFHIEGRIDSTLVFGAHYDAYGFKTQSILPGADDNISGVAVLLGLVNRIKEKGITPKYCIDICFWDGEEIGRYGSKHYVNQLNDNKRKKMIYINIDTVGSELFYQVTLSFYNSSNCLNNYFYSLASDLTIPIEEYNSLFTTDCEPFVKKGIPVVNICCDKLPPYLHKSSDVISNVSMNQINKIARAIYENLIIY